MTTCAVCHRPLTSPSSIAAGVGPKCAKSTNSHHLSTLLQSQKATMQATLPKSLVGCYHCGHELSYYDAVTKQTRCVQCYYIWDTDEFMQDAEDPHLYRSSKTSEICFYCGSDEHGEGDDEVDRCSGCGKPWFPNQEETHYEVRR